MMDDELWDVFQAMSDEDKFWLVKQIDEEFDCEGRKHAAFRARLEGLAEFKSEMWFAMSYFFMRDFGDALEEHLNS